MALIMKMVTKEFRLLVKQFIMFRELTWTLLDNQVDYSQRLIKAEKVVASSFPVLEQKHASKSDRAF